MTLLKAENPTPLRPGHSSTANLFLKKNTVSVIGATVAFGQPIPGVEKGPDALREAGLSKVIKSLNWEVVDRGNTDASVASKEDVTDIQRDIPEDVYSSDEVPKSHELGRACGNVFRAVNTAAKDGHFVLTLGGDHSIGAATLSGIFKQYPDICVLWVDAHADINTPELSPSGHYHGMPVAHVMGWFKKRAPGFSWMNSVPILPETRLGYIGLRSIDDGERKLLKTSFVCAKTAQDVENEGVATVLRKALSWVDPHNNRPIHLSFDIDACDPSVAPGTGTRCRGGLTYREAIYICQSLYSTRRLVSMDLVEVNPEIDHNDERLHGDNPFVSRTATKTVRLGLDIIASALGFTIL